MSKTLNADAFQHFPNELKALIQWCAAGKGEPGSPTYKAPINPHTGGLAKVDEPATWGTFEQAQAMGYGLVGFVFSENDPYSVIDLDTYKAQ
jgi:putative DNA primase/helicase